MEIVRMALDRVDWARDDPRWFEMLEQPLRTWTHGSVSEAWDKTTYLTCFRLLLDRCDPNLRGRPTDGGQFGLTTLHNIVARGNMTSEERAAFERALAGFVSAHPAATVLCTGPWAPYSFAEAT